jgi:hypothetical protein
MPAVGSSMARSSREYFGSGAGLMLISVPAAKTNPIGRAMPFIGAPIEESE